MTDARTSRQVRSDGHPAEITETYFLKSQPDASDEHRESNEKSDEQSDWESYGGDILIGRGCWSQTSEYRKPTHDDVQDSPAHSMTGV